MNRKKIMMMMIVICMSFIFTSVYATSMNTSVVSSGSPGATVNFSVGGDFIGRVNISVSNGSGNTSVWVENNTKSVSVTLGTSGSTTITATPEVGTSDLNGDPATIAPQNKSVSIVQPTPTPAPSTNTNTSSTTNNTNTNNNTNTSKTSTKSSDAYLKSLILSVEGLNPAFSKNITNYSVSVGENVSSIDVKAIVENNKATYSVNGNTGLVSGENTIIVKVTAEDGTTKTYKINVIKSNDPVKADATLSSLIIEDVNLGQDFDPNVTEYNAGDVTVKGKKLNIFTSATNEKANVQIIGNENLKEGENTITIRVTSEDGKIVKDYVVKFNKVATSDDDVDIYGDKLALKDTTSLWDKLKDFYNSVLKDSMAIILLYFFVWFEFIQVVYLYEKLKKQEKADAKNSLMTEAVEIDSKGKARRVLAREQAGNQVENDDKNDKSSEDSSKVNQEIEEINNKIDGENNTEIDKNNE